MSKRLDLTGQKFGRLTVIEPAEPTISANNHKTYRWKCLCDCGNPEYVIVGTNNLKTGHTQSCGCYKSYRSSITKLKENKYDLSGEYGIGYTTKNEPFYFDLEDYDKIKDYCWWMDHDGYICATTTLYKENKKRNIKMHRLVMNVIDDLDVDVDHIKHCKMDNRKSMLRVCSHKENCWNSDKNSISVSVAGVRKTRSNKWLACIWVGRKLINLGRFINYDDAVQARKDAEEKYYGEYSYDNSMK